MPFLVAKATVLNCFCQAVGGAALNLVVYIKSTTKAEKK